MSQADFDPRELHPLIDRWCEGSLDAEGVTRLNQLLAEHAAARQEFLRISEVHGLLALGESEAAVSEEKSQMPVNAAEPHVAYRAAVAVRQFFARPTPISLSVATAVVAMVIGLMAVIAPPFYRAVMQRPAPPPGETLGIVAELTRTVQAKWVEENSRPHLGAFLIVGRRLELEAGLIEIEYRNGARLIVEGPAALVIGNGRGIGKEAYAGSGGLGELEVGKLTADLEGVPRGQAIGTPWGAVVHVGTEFGVRIDERGETEVQVFQGEVELHRREASRNSHVIARLRAGESGVVKSDGSALLAEQAAKAEFVRPRRFGDLHEQASQVVAIWHFDDPQQLGQATDPSVPPLKVVGDAQFTPDGRFGGALELDGDGDMLEASRPIPRLPVGNSPYTVAAWIKPTTVGKRGIIGWGAYRQNGRVNALRLDEDNKGFRHYWWGEEFGYDLVVAGDTVSEAGVDLDAGQWVHVAVTWDGNTRRLYVNGKQIAQDQPPQPNVALEQFAIGCTARHNDEFFSGLLDDVRIYRVAMDAEQVKAIMSGQSLTRSRRE